MKTFLVLALSLAALPAFARPNTQDLTCAQSFALVKKSGSIVLSTGDGLFAKFVSDGRYCDRTQSLAPAYVPTRDQEQCWTGYVCAGKDANGAQIFPRHIRTCTEGQEEILSVPGSGDSDQRELFVCRNGKWEQKFGGSTGGSVGEPLACKEGQEQVLDEQDSSGDHSQRVLYVCRGGKWVKEF